MCCEKKLGKKIRREIQCFSFNVQTKMKKSKERQNTAPRKEDMKFVRGKESREQDDLRRSGPLTQENISKDKKVTIN